MSVTHSPSHAKSYYTTTNPFEKKFGYYRAVRKGAFIFVSGCTSIDPETGKTDYPGDAFQQALAAMARCVDAVEKLVGRREDVVRARMFVANHSDTAAVGNAFRQTFSSHASSAESTTPTTTSEIGAAATMIFVPGGFVDPGILVEVEIDVVCT